MAVTAALDTHFFLLPGSMQNRIILMPVPAIFRLCSNTEGITVPGQVIIHYIMMAVSGTGKHGHPMLGKWITKYGLCRVNPEGLIVMERMVETIILRSSAVPMGHGYMGPDINQKKYLKVMK